MQIMKVLFNGLSPLFICLVTACIKSFNLKLLENHLERMISWNICGFHFDAHSRGGRLLGERIQMTFSISNNGSQ